MLESLLKNTGTILMEQMYHSQFIIVNHCTTKTQEKELRKQQWRHDFRVALFSAVIGGFTGFLATVVTQMLL